MLNIQTITESIQNEVKIDSEGKGIISLRGASRLLALGSNQLSHQYMAVILVQTLTHYGFEPASFAIKGIPDVALGLIANYFAYESKADNPQAKAVAQFLSAIGSRTVMQQIKGWIPSIPKSSKEAFAELVELARQFTVAQFELPKLDQNLSHYYRDDNALPATPMTYKEYIKSQGVVLTVPQRSDFVTRLSTWCKQNDVPPTKIIRGTSKYNQYDSKHFDFMSALLDEVLTTSYKPSRKAEEMFRNNFVNLV
jgi:hypothetical protein